MGMAASQARHLALVARKSNCEYEGQQINQARTALANQSANLFNQMLGLKVPVPPSTQDFTKTQYSYSDGLNASTIDSWQQLAENDENYNYIVTHHYYADVYTGSQKKLSDPQVQFAGNIPTSSLEYASNIAQIQQYKVELEERLNDYEAKSQKYQQLVNNSKILNTYNDSSQYLGLCGSNAIKNAQNVVTNFEVNIQETAEDTDGNKYTVFLDSADNTIKYYYDGKEYYTDITNKTKLTDLTKVGGPSIADTDTFVKFSELTGTDQTAATTALNNWNKLLAEGVDPADLYYCADTKTFAFAKDLSALIGQTGGVQTTLPVYNLEGAPADGEGSWKSIDGMERELAQAKQEMDSAKALLDMAESSYNSLSVPQYIGNSQLNNLSSLTSDQSAEIAQIIKTMKEEGIDSNFDKYYNIETGEYNGGIYSFKLNGKTYYTTYDDLADSASTGNGINNIDGQIKLAYYNADYISTKIEKTEKALLETDGNGRFTSIRFEDDSVMYTLNMETVTDDAAYQDAMNQYNYENAKYDKMIQDINAKTSIIQQQDTEHNALSTEIDAVSKVVSDNVEKSFKTFGG